MIPTEPENADIADPAEDMPAPDQQPPDMTSAPAPEDETPEQFMRRLVEENSWRIKPRPPRPTPPPEPKSIHLMTPEEMHESLPVHLRRRRSDGSYYAMGLISRMQTDLEELTQGKRAATYPEVAEYLGYALLAEGLAPRGYSADEATRWWKAGGSQVLWDSGPSAEPNEPVSDMAVRSDAADASTYDLNLAGTDDSVDRDDIAMPQVPQTEMSEPFGRPGESQLVAYQAALQPRRGVGAEPRLATTKAPNPDTASKQKERPPAPLGTNLSTYDTGFGGPGHGIDGDYRTTPQERAWLEEFRSLAGPDEPYPDGTPGSHKSSSKGRRKIREDVAYLYTLPEVKAFLDLLSQTEGSAHDGYSTNHGGDPRLKDLKDFYGTSPKGRYQITLDNWRDYGEAMWSRKDFSEISQDLVAITLLRQKGVIKELLAGNLSGALSKAAPLFASIPLSSEKDYSAYRYGGKTAKETDPTTSPPRQPTPRPFNSLPELFVQRLNARRKEFRQAEQAWKTTKELPKAFISPLRWGSLDLDGL